MKYVALLFLFHCTLIATAQVVKNRSVHREVHFASGSATIDGSQRDAIAFVCEQIQGRDNYLVRLKGNTDSVGTYKGNLALSLRRAHAVENELLKCGASAPLIKINGLSFTEPKTSDATEDGKAKNRRTEISLTLIYFPVSALEPVDALKPGSTLDLHVLFNFNSAVLKHGSSSNLDHMIELLHEHPDLRFEILGWTAISTTKDDLSGKRAKVVYDLFLEQGISPDRMSFKGMGGAGCPDNGRLDQCRRVEIVITRNPYLKSIIGKP